MADTKEFFNKILNLSTTTKNFVDYLTDCNLDLENKILFYIYFNDKCCPLDLIDEFKIKKTNLAIICKGLQDKGFIIKNKDAIDRRSIKYSILQLGLNHIDCLMKIVNERKKIVDNNYQSEIINLTDRILEILKK